MKSFFWTVSLLFSLFAFAQVESPEQRIAKYTLQIRANPDSISNYIGRSKAYNDKRKFAAAIEDCNTVLRFDPNNKAALKARGFAFCYLQKFDSSIADFNKVLQQDKKDAEAWNWRGNSYYYLNKLDLALNDYSEALVLDQKYASAWLNRGETFYWQSKYDEAIGDLSESLLYDPKNIRAFYIRGMCYYYSGKYVTAIDDFTQGLAIDPENVDMLNSRGLNYYFIKKTDLALADYTEALRIDPRSGFAWINRGNLYKNSGKNNLAVTDYTQALLYEPKNADALFSRGNANYSLGKFEESVKDFTELFTVEKKSAEALTYRGDAFTKLNNYDAALKDYTEAVTLNPKNADVLASRGILYAKMNKPDLALKDFDEAVQVNPKSVFALTHRGDFYSSLKKDSLAIKDYNEVLIIDPKTFDARNNRGNSFYYTGKYDLAISDYTMILLQNPKVTSALLNRGNAYRYIGRYDSAFADYTQAIRIDPQSAEAWSSRGYFYYLSGKYDSAVLDFNKSLNLDPQNSNAFNNRGLTYYNTGKFDLAIADFKKALQLKPDNSVLMINQILVYLANDQFGEAAALYKLYRQKNLKSYVENFKGWSFLKKYITACTDFIATKEYAKALPLLQASLEEYVQVNGEGTVAIPIILEYTNVLQKKAFVYEQLGQNIEALDYYTKAQIINPRLSNLTLKIARLSSAIAADKATNSSPEIFLTSPSVIEGTIVQKSNNSNQLLISGKVKDANGIAWIKINGISVSSKADGQFAYTINSDVTGFKIEAANKKGVATSVNYNMAAATENTNLKIPPIPPTEKPVFHAILIACSDYSGKKWNKLSSTVTEAQAYKTMLVNHYGFDEKNVTEIYNKPAREILNLLSSKMESLHDNDNLIILFAGHGTYFSKNNVTIGYWVPLKAEEDANDYISNSNLGDIVTRCDARHILILSDACYSGAFRGEDKEGPKLEKQVEYKLKSRQILTSVGLQKAPEESIFIKMVIRMLDVNNEKFLTSWDLYQLIAKTVLNQTGTKPGLNTFGQSDNEPGQFFFIRYK